MMIKAVLLDLDNTLLRNQDHVFAVDYLRLLDEYFSKRLGQPDFSNSVLAAIRAMVGERDMQRTNADLTLSILQDAVDQPSEMIRQAFDDFYRERYPTLQRLAAPISSAAAIIADLKAQQYAVVIATNPLYPAEAIRQRLSWAGLPDNFDEYALVTHADNMHFAKPTAALYAEAIARVGVEPDEAIMIGDSVKNDMLPARQVGLHTFLVTDTPLDDEALQMDGCGSLDDFRNALKNGWLETLVPRPIQPVMIEPEMRGNIAALFGTLADARPHYWTQHPDPDEWSPIQIICHLFESERTVQRPRLERILTEDNPFLVAPKPPPGPREASPCDSDGYRTAERFKTERLQTLDWLKRLQIDDWSRSARHSIFGNTTLLEMAHFTAQHDRLHINQLCQTLGRCQ